MYSTSHGGPTTKSTVRLIVDHHVYFVQPSQVDFMINIVKLAELGVGFHD